MKQNKARNIYRINYKKIIIKRNNIIKTKMINYQIKELDLKNKRT